MFKPEIYVVFLLVTVCQSARILGIFPTPSISHQVVFRAITNELAKRGHEIVVMTTDPQRSEDPSYKNITEIDVHDISYEIWNKALNYVKIRDFFDIRYDLTPLVYHMLHDIFDAQMKMPEMKKLLNDQHQHFDLLLVEVLIPSSFAFSERFNVPIIGVGSQPAFINVWEATGNPTHPMLYTDILSLYNGNNMSFSERLDNLYWDLWYRHYFYGHVIDLFEKQKESIFGPGMSHVRNFMKSFDMLFINCFPVLCGIRPLTPATVLFGGLHLNDKKPIPKDIQEYLDKSSQGVIYFSLGSNAKSNQLPPERRQIMMDALGELPYNVMWKYEDDTLPGKPDNVFTSKWFPQYDMLGHPNIKAMIFQGGQQSLEEAIFSGVPLICIPILGDQNKYAKTIVAEGIGLRIEMESLTKESFKQAILEVANNKKYKENVLKLSTILSDSPMTSRESVVWWTEYVLRHKGATHLRSPIMDMPLHQYFMLDVFAFILAMVLLFLYIIIRILRALFPKKEGKLKLS